VDRDDSAGVRRAYSFAGRRHHLSLGRLQESRFEPPGRLFPEDAGGGAVLIALDHAAGDVEVTVGEHERRGVQPERVMILRGERRRAVAGDRVERRGGRRLGPEGIPPAGAADHLTGCVVCADEFECLRE